MTMPPYQVHPSMLIRCCFVTRPPLKIIVRCIAPSCSNANRLFPFNQPRLRILLTGSKRQSPPKITVRLRAFEQLYLGKFSIFESLVKASLIKVSCFDFSSKDRPTDSLIKSRVILHNSMGHHRFNPRYWTPACHISSAFCVFGRDQNCSDAMQKEASFSTNDNACSLRIFCAQAGRQRMSVKAH